MVEQIIVVDNGARPLSRDRAGRLIASYGRFSARVVILRHDVVATVPPAIGWRRQQILKLAVSNSVSTDFYVVLDAKNHLVASASVATFVGGGGRPKASLYSYASHPLRSSLEDALDYVGLDREKYIGRFFSTATPSVIVTAVARDLIAQVEAREGMSFAQFFLQRHFTEFLLYAAWIESSDIPLAARYDTSGIRNSTIWPRGRSLESLTSTLFDAGAASFFSVHRTALARMDRAATRLIEAFWTERGLFSSQRSARRFVGRFRRRYLLAMVEKRLGERGL